MCVHFTGVQCVIHCLCAHSEEERINAYEIASTKKSWQRCPGWKLQHFSAQLNEMVSTPCCHVRVQNHKHFSLAKTLVFSNGRQVPVEGCGYGCGLKMCVDFDCLYTCS